MNDPFEKIGEAGLKTFDDVLQFGKYKGSTIGEIADEDPKYLEGCLDNVDDFAMSDEDEETIRQDATDENDEWNWRPERD